MSTPDLKSHEGGWKADSNLQKITFELPPAEWHEHVSESAWAQPMGADLYRIQNVPFYARGFAYGDVVHARPGQPFPIVDSVVQRSGHSTYRVISDPEVFARRWPALSIHGCTFERADGRLVAIDVPANTDIRRVYRALEQGVQEGDWDFEEGYCGHPI